MITVPLRSGASCILFRGHGAALTIRYHPIACHGNLSRRLLYITNDAGADISASSRYGLLGLGMYRCPDDFITRAHEVVAKCRLIRQRVCSFDRIYLELPIEYVIIICTSIWTFATITGKWDRPNRRATSIHPGAFGRSVQTDMFRHRQVSSHI